MHLQVYPALAAALLGAALRLVGRGRWRAHKDGVAALFSNERFATVKPRLVAGRFIRKGSSLSFVEGVCVVGGRVYRIYHIKQ